MRPEIPDEMVERIEELEDRHGYVSAAEFVRDTVRRRLERLESDRPEKIQPTLAAGRALERHPNTDS